MAASNSVDLLLAGGGLANGLIALRLAELQPRLRLLLVERGPSLGGQHTWSFHDSDLTAAEHRWVAPLLARSWDTHSVVFPRYRRVLPSRYHSITSDRFHQVLSGRLGEQVLLGAGVRHLDPGGATLDDGTRIDARCVIDGRGYPAGATLRLGYQKFLGLELQLDAPHGLADPVLMDATVPQTDGYRFFYLLPWSQTRLLVEDTYYSDTPELRRDALRAGVLEYAAARGWKLRSVEREEAGVLPIPLEGRLEKLLGPPGDPIPRSGLRAGLFHATTSYSLPCAVRLADEIARLGPPDSASLAAFVRRRSEQHWRDGRYYRLLNRMLFLAAQPERRFVVFQRFYGLGLSRIERFYAGRLTLGDRVRILCGRPPVPVFKALRAALDLGTPAP